MSHKRNLPLLGQYSDEDSSLTVMADSQKIDNVNFSERRIQYE